MLSLSSSLIPHPRVLATESGMKQWEDVGAARGSDANGVQRVSRDLNGCQWGALVQTGVKGCQLATLKGKSGIQ